MVQDYFKEKLFTEWIDTINTMFSFHAYFGCLSENIGSKSEAL